MRFVLQDPLMNDFKSVPKKYQPKGFEILHEDLDLIVGNKAPGYLTVSALWNQDDTIHDALNQYVRKGNPKSSKVVFVVHRLDQATTGVLVFAKSEQAMNFLKDNWQTTEKTYLAVVRGQLKQKSGLIESYLTEDEDYVVKSDNSPAGQEEGRLSRTEYEVLAQNEKFSLVKINLLTGRKNQIRVHMADIGNPVVGDGKYGLSDPRHKNLALHSKTLTITHPHSKKRLTFEAQVPSYFQALIDYDYGPLKKYEQFVKPKGGYRPAQKNGPRTNSRPGSKPKR